MNGVYMGGEINWKDAERDIISKAMKRVRHREKGMDYLRELEGDSGCGKPGCPIPKRREPCYPRCSLNEPLMLYIPPGGHAHIDCPVHGSHIVYGPNISYNKWVYDGPMPKVTWKKKPAIKEARLTSKDLWD